jgi:hypothetical protein
VTAVIGLTGAQNSKYYIDSQPQDKDIGEMGRMAQQAEDDGSDLELEADILRQSAIYEDGDGLWFCRCLCREVQEQPTDLLVNPWG